MEVEQSNNFKKFVQRKKSIIQERVQMIQKMPKDQVEPSTLEKNVNEKYGMSSRPVTESSRVCENTVVTNRWSPLQVRKTGGAVNLFES